MILEYNPLLYKVALISKIFWKDFAIQIGEAREVMEKGQSQIFSFPDFTLEIFHRLYYEPEPEKLNPAPPEAAWAEQLHEAFTHISEFEQLTERCQTNQLAAGMAAVEFCKTVWEQLPQPKQPLNNPQEFRSQVKHLKKQQQKAAQERQQHELREENGELPGSDRSEAELQQQIDNLVRQGKNAVEAATAYAASLDESKIRGMLRTAARSAGKKLDEVASWLAAFGQGWGNNPSSDNNVPIADKIELARRIGGDRQLQAIALLAGRLKDIADRKRRTKSPDAFGELCGIELGNDLARLMPSELVKLAVPEMFPLFARGYYDRSLLQYKIEGKEKQSLGPLVVCLDSSDSMRGTPDMWAKAVTLVLAQIAQQEGRHFRVIHFGSDVRRVDDFPPRHPNLLLLLDSMASFYAGGGTNWEQPLQLGIDCIRLDRAMKKGDIVLITDGDCNVSAWWKEKFFKQRQELEFNVFGVLIQSDRDQTLKPLCDRLWKVADLKNDAVIEELFLV